MGWLFDDEEETEEIEELEESEESEEHELDGKVYTAEELEKFRETGRIKRRIYAIIHLILSIGTFIGCCVWIKEWWLAVLVYVGGYVLIQAIFALLPNLGTYEEGGYVDVYEGNGRYRKEWNENAVTRYGFLDIIKDLIAHAIFFLIVLFLVMQFLPKFIFFYVLIAEIGIAVVKYLILPIIKDIVHIISKFSKEKLFNTIDKFVAATGLVLVIIATIGSYIVFPQILPEKLDMQCFERYAERKEETNNLKNLSFDELDIEFKHGSTYAQITYEGDFDLGNGIIKKGKVDAVCEYDLERWNVSSIHYTYDGEVKIVSPVTYVEEKSSFSSRNYDKPVIIKLRIDYYDGTSGKGNYEVLDKETNNVILTSPLSIVPAFNSGMEFHFEGDDKIGLFGVLEGEYNMDSDTIIISYVGQSLKAE